MNKSKYSIFFDSIAGKGSPEEKVDQLKKIIVLAKKDLNGRILFISKEGKINLSIDGIEFSQLDKLELENVKAALKDNHSKNKIKDLLLLKETAIADRVADYCIKKKISPEDFLAAASSLMRIRFFFR